MSKILYLTPRVRTMRVERVAVPWRATWRDWAVCLGLIGTNLLIVMLVLLGACDAVAWVLA